MSGRNTTMICPLNLRKEFHSFTFIRDIERQLRFLGEGDKRPLWQVCLLPWERRGLVVFKWLKLHLNLFSPRAIS